MFTPKHTKLFQTWTELHAAWKANGLPFADMLELELAPGAPGEEIYRIVIAGQTARVPLTGFEDLGGPVTANRLLRVAVFALVIDKAGNRDAA
jgi:hypothetical protein